jgi:uncharacterized protein YkwD
MIEQTPALRRVQRSGARVGWCLPVILGLALLFALLVAVVTVRGDAGKRRPVRLVLSSLDDEQRALALSTTSLYAPDDPWKRYLASEAECPGGERTRLPVAQQVETVACLVNYARRLRGLSELVVRPVLNGASTRKAQAMVRCESFAHNPCGGDWKAAVRSMGYAGTFGENLYLASGRWAAPRVAVDAWLNSPTHRENMFRPEWRDQGYAVLRQDSFGVYRDVSLWVSVLGDR